MGGTHRFIESPGDGRGLLVALDGRIKLLLLLGALAVNLTAGGSRTPLCLGILALLLVGLAGVSTGAFLQRMAMPAVLATVAMATQLFWFQEGAVALTVPFFAHSLAIHWGGVWRGLELAERILGGMAVLLFFALTTPLPELLRAARWFRCPPVLVELTLLMYRYIFLLLEEGGRIRTAERSRLGFVDFRSGLRSSSILGGMLVLRTYDRAERSFAAMRCRGYRGVVPVADEAPPQGRDWLALALGLALLATVYLIR